MSVFWDGLLESRPRRNFRCRAVVVVRQGAVASKGGAPAHPAWFLNMEAAEEVAFQVAQDHFVGPWREAEGEERARIWAGMVDIYPPYTHYQEATTRRIPVIVLTPARTTDTL